MLLKGNKALSDAELLTILIGTGTKNRSALDISKNILESVNHNLYNLGKLSVKDLLKFKGIGKAKAVTIYAALELGRRRKESDVDKKTKITCSADIYDYILPTLSDLSYEEFWVISLNKSNIIIDSFLLSRGGLEATIVDIKILCKKVLDVMASGIILCHNHPSGNNQASQADIKITQKIKQALNTFDIKLLDHIIVTDRHYFSFADEGHL